jgi:hypothetical protein
MSPGTIAIFVIAPVLLWAGLEKVRNTAPIAATLRGLGVPRPLSQPIAGLVAATEVLLALQVVFRPYHILAQTGIVTLAALFAIAGLIAMASGKSIRCSCFGVGGGGYLGRSQLAALPLWIAGAGFLKYGGTETPSLETGALYLAGISLAIAGIQGIRVIRSQTEARKDRLSAREMYIWLRRS